MPESFKFDVRVRERLLRKGEITEAEIEKNLEGLADTAANATTIELKQPAFQTEAERAENAVVVRAAPPRPITLAAPINLDEEDDDDDEEPLPRKAAPVEKVERVEKAPEKAVAKSDDADVAKDTDSDDADEDDDDDDDADDDEDEDDDDADEDEDDADEDDGEKKDEPSDADDSGANS